MGGTDGRRAAWVGVCLRVGAVISAATVFGFAGRVWWVFDLFAHFRVQYLVSLSLIVLLVLLGRRFRAASVFGLFAAANLACVLPYYLPVESATHDGAAALRLISLRLISVNVHTANDRFDLVKQLIHDHDPDVVLLMEVDGRWMGALEELRGAYPYQQIASREDNFGIALYSKRPFTKHSTVYLGEPGVPSVVGEVEVAGRKLTIVGTHPLPPVSATHTAWRNGQLTAVAEYVADIDGPKILMGDLNTSPWSHCFRHLIDRAGLVDSARGRGVAGTWPSHHWWHFWLRIPIDFCLVSDEIAVTDKQVGPNVGSDHLPLVVDLIIG